MAKDQERAQNRRSHSSLFCPGSSRHLQQQQWGRTINLSILPSVYVCWPALLSSLCLPSKMKLTDVALKRACLLWVSLESCSLRHCVCSSSNSDEMFKNRNMIHLGHEDMWEHLTTPPSFSFIVFGAREKPKCDTTVLFGNPSAMFHVFPL